MKTLDLWLDDIPQQFRCKKNIEILIQAFSKQLDELYQVFLDLNDKTTIENASGQNLRYIGDILSLTTKEAYEILLKANQEEITDELYRKVLKYKMRQNSCDCTYYDIMESIYLLWDTDIIHYVEDPERPATIFITIPYVDIDGIDPSIGRVLAINPSGVAMLYANGYVTGVNISCLEKAFMENLFITLGVDFRNQLEIPALKMNTQVKTGGKVSVSAILYKNYWVLDGTYLLDGSKKLNAEKIEEEL